MTSVNAAHFITAPSRVAVARAMVRAAIIAAADQLHETEDAAAWRDGLTVRRVGLTGRAYRDPRFSTRRIGGSR